VGGHAGCLLRRRAREAVERAARRRLELVDRAALEVAPADDEQATTANASRWASWLSIASAAALASSIGRPCI
jgi:hypothetical protein